MYTYIKQAIANFLNDNKDPFDAGDLLEVKEIVEYVEVKTPHLSAELIGEILARVEDPCKIVKLMGVNKTWYLEGRRFLFKNKDKIMEEFRLKSIIKLEPFIRFLNLDRLDEFIKINKNIQKQFDELYKQYEEAYEEHTVAFSNYMNYIEANGLYEWEMDYDLMNLLLDEENDDEEYDEDIIIPVEPVYHDKIHEELSKILKEKILKRDSLYHSASDKNEEKQRFKGYISMKVLKLFG